MLKPIRIVPFIAAIPIISHPPALVNTRSRQGKNIEHQSLTPLDNDTQPGYTGGVMATKRSYSETEKIGTMLMALNEGVPVAAQRTETPMPTIYEWFNEGGGILKVRSFLESAMLNAGFAAKRAVYDEVVKRAPQAQDTEVFVTFREMMREAAGQGPAAAQAGAQAAATLQVVIQGKDGEPEVIEVPRE